MSCASWMKLRYWKATFKKSCILVRISTVLRSPSVRLTIWNCLTVPNFECFEIDHALILIDTPSTPWQSSIRGLANLRSYKINAPLTQSRILTSTFLEMAVDALQACHKLRHVYIDMAIYSYHMPSLRRLQNVSSVQLGRPSRTVVSQMSSWLDSLITPLQCLALHVGISLFCFASATNHVAFTSEEIKLTPKR